MPVKQRFHVHVCIVRNEHPEFENALQLALSDEYFLTWDLIAHPSQFMDYSKQQIDRCDYLLFVLGTGYGHLSPSGVSNLHLSYIYANTKRKPMLALIKSQNATSDYSRQRLDLASMIQKDLLDNAIFYERTQEAVSECQRALNALIGSKPTAGWVRANKPDTSLRTTGVSKPQVITPVATAKPKVVEPKIILKAEDVVLVNYSAHAYQDGNLQDVMAAHTFTWGEVLELLKILPQPFSSEMMLKQLNDSLKNLALIEASKILPNVHAVSRCQINAVDFQWLKQQLVDSGWLVSAKEEHSNRELWRVNPTMTN
ncbi:DUF4062 domain-containing protein [Faucicola mancuniensis]|uniref:DUF4062 domain-containing protein n=1 Tax=Faucicola mancuniensis TaxID=1309795 RepID=UPI0039777F68